MNRKQIFSELRKQLYINGKPNTINEVTISFLNNSKLIIEEIKNLQVIELDSLDDFLSYVNYDHFLLFKFKKEYYFCDTELVQSLGEYSMLKISDFNQHLRKDKIKKINDLN